MREYLTIDQLAEPEKYNIFDIPFHVNPYSWSRIDQSLSQVLGLPERFKFDENILEALANKKRGIYIFAVEYDLPLNLDINKYLLYIGRVSKTNSFKKRIRKYVNNIGVQSDKVTFKQRLLANAWKGITWVYVYDLQIPDDEIDRIERILISSIKPFINSNLKAKSARNPQNLYGI